MPGKLLKTFFLAKKFKSILKWMYQFTLWWKWKSLSSLTLRSQGLHSPWNSPDQNTREGSLSLLPGIFPSQGQNPGLPHYRRILYQLSHKGSPRILEWAASPFSSGSSQLKNRTGVILWYMSSLHRSYFMGLSFDFSVNLNCKISFSSFILSAQNVGSNSSIIMCYPLKKCKIKNIEILYFWYFN